jgi:hypothetical protein
MEMDACAWPKSFSDRYSARLIQRVVAANSAGRVSRSHSSFDGQ